MQTQDHIRRSMQGVIEFITQNPDQAVGPDSYATAVVDERLCVRATGPTGQTLVCDMPQALVGGATAPRPGWMTRAVLENCEAAMVALRAAQLEIELTTLEELVDSHSDDRGMLGLDDSVPAGPLDMRITFRIGAPWVSPQALEGIVE